ncbi:MAG TPA: YifB family Mg chelatase-like AAA ATPase [Thermoleophilaceae bacterium]|nr:YifB family Mg chelatase-like AAA ATPase [Thermoleophilaceae bacterium]
MLASIATFALEGVDSREVTVEVDVRPGLPVFTVVGLPDAAVREARERVRAALLNSGFEFPLQRLTANLAPAHVRKAGPSFDLALAVALLAASRQLPPERLESCAVCGELSLGGELRPVHGAVAVAVGARAAGYRRLIVPSENAAEAALVDGIEVLGAPSLERLVDLVAGRWTPPAPAVRAQRDRSREIWPDLDEVHGQSDARRALEIAAAGGHNLLMIGPPGAGKTMLARRLPGILPPPSFEEALEITRVHSVAGISDGTLAQERPFRAPHHTISPSGLVGGGSTPRPGEITLAHRGVLFLDELAEFSRPALEALRQPLEEGVVKVTRGQRSLVFPAATMLIAACNSCPCGRPPSDCMCDGKDRMRYHRRLSGPLVDRIDLVCQLDASPQLEVARGRPESSAAVRERVLAARELQLARFAGAGIHANAEMDARLTDKHVRLPADAMRRLLSGNTNAPLSARSHDRVLRLARTIADLDGRPKVRLSDVDEALGYKLNFPLAVAA